MESIYQCNLSRQLQAGSPRRLFSVLVPGGFAEQKDDCHRHNALKVPWPVTISPLSLGMQGHAFIGLCFTSLETLKFKEPPVTRDPTLPKIKGLK